MNFIYAACILYIVLSAIPVYLLFRWKRKHEQDLRNLSMQYSKMAIAQLNQTLLISDLSERMASLEPKTEESKTQ